MRLPLPISVRLALFYGLTLLLLLGAFAVFCYAGFHLALHRNFDRHLTHEQRELLPYAVTDEGVLRFEGLEALTSVAYQTDGVYGTYVRLLAPGGGVRYRSPNFEGHAPLPVDLPTRAEEASVSRTWEGLPARTRYVPIRAEGALLGWLEVTGFEWSLHHELYQLRTMLLSGVLLSALFAFGCGWWLARRALRPVATMTEAARRMGAPSGPRALEARLPADFGPPDELTELAETFNGLLERLEASVARERRFTANAAHELLTPLATLRSEAEVALRREREAPAYREAIERIVLDVERMTATVQGLLELARAERLQKRAGSRLDLSDLVRVRAQHARADAEAKGVALTTRVEPGVIVAAEAAPLAEIADNLLSNAVKYTPPGGSVAVELRHGASSGDVGGAAGSAAGSAAGGAALLRVRDTGVGFEPEEAGHLFDRFYRSDDAAVQAQQGSGLGLALVRAIAEAYGGSVRAESGGPGRGATFEVRLPCLACAT
jgi:signal transduction histidine kinase